jgi:formate-dependent phosphoribosylglycinamide formyltransferase (GAR transformylase)
VMSKVLLVDTNFSSAPIHSALVKLGHVVHVIGSNPNDCLAKISTNYWNQDYSDTEALGRLVEREGFDFIVPGCTDRSYTSCAIVSNGRFPGIETIAVDQLINNKMEFRLLTEKLHLPAPKVIESELESLRWPLIVKPVDAFSGRGVTVINVQNRSSLVRAIERACSASASAQYLLEDYVVGALHSHSAFLENGKVTLDFIVQEDCTVNEFVVDTSRVIFDPPENLLLQLRTSIESLAQALCLKNGLLHTQFILNGDRIWLIEVTRRCPGDLYSQLIELSCGFSYAENYVRPFLGLPQIRITNTSNRSHVMRHTVTVPASQSSVYISYTRELFIERWVSLCLVGDQLKPSPASRVGILFAKARSEVGLNEIYQAALSRELYKILQ